MAPIIPLVADGDVPPSAAAKFLDLPFCNRVAEGCGMRFSFPP